MRNFRNLVDLTPGDSHGSSFWGLTRGQAKKLALAFIIVAVLMFIPMGATPSPDDLINFYLAEKMVDYTGLNYINNLVLTYTLIPFILLLVGIYIYPYNSRSLFNGYMNKSKLFIKRKLRDPKSIIIGAVIFIVVFSYYKNHYLGGI